jgi:hypothetical protein
MREIKFRAWGITKTDGTKEMMPWETTRHAIGEWIGNAERGVILMQFTGLHDKNGVEIFEGDIVKTTNGIFPIEWRGGFYCKRPDETAFSIYDGYDFEVIGNVYQHPELLESKVATQINA